MLMLQRQSSRRKTEWLAYNNTTASTVTYGVCTYTPLTQKTGFRSSKYARYDRVNDFVYFIDPARHADCCIALCFAAAMLCVLATTLSALSAVVSCRHGSECAVRRVKEPNDTVLRMSVGGPPLSDC